MKWILLGAALLGILMLAWRSFAQTSGQASAVGQPAPEFTLSDQHGKKRALTDFRGKWLVVYFYPKDDTPGCTEQACKFRDDLHRLTGMGAEVVGISVDTSASHAEFAGKYSLPFPLLADEQGEVAERYGSITDLYVIKFAKRNTFLIDPHGRIARVYLKANTSRNSAEVIADLMQLAAK